VHIVGTRVAEGLLNVTTTYESVLIAQWVAAPWLGALQAALVLTVGRTLAPAFTFGCGPNVGMGNGARCF
jgi:hypothetical protein